MRAEPMSLLHPFPTRFLAALVFLVVAMGLGAGGRSEGNTDVPTGTASPLSTDTAKATASLEAFVAYGLAFSPVLRVNALGQEREEALLKEARARRLPVLDLSATASLLGNPPKGLTFPAGSLATAPILIPAEDVVLMPDTENTYFTLKPSLTLPIFTFGKLSLGIEAARLSAEKGRLGLEQARIDLERDLILGWHGIALARHSMAGLTEGLGLLEAIRDDTRKQYDQGLVNLEAVLQAEKSVAALRSTLIRTREGLARSWQALALAAGLPDHSPVPDLPWPPAGMTIPNLPAPGSPEEAALVNRMVGGYRPLAQARLDASLAGVGADLAKAQGSLRPDLVLQAQYEFKGQKVPFTTDYADTWEQGLTITLAAQGNFWKPGTGAARSAAALQEDQATLGAVLQERRAALDALEALATVRERVAALDERAAARAHADEVARNATVAFENGILIRKDWLGARLQAIQAGLEEAGARYALMEALVNLDTWR